MSDISKYVEPLKDECGRLYDPALRNYLCSFVSSEDARRLEAFASLRWLMQELRHNRSRRTEKHGLSEGRFELLMRLKFDGDAPLGELANDLHVSARNVTGLVDHLERDGLVQRVPDPKDRRSVHAHLTDMGSAAIDKLWRQILDSTLEMIKDISQDELDQLRHTSVRLLQSLRTQTREVAEAHPDGSEAHQEGKRP
jgi:DNA-binding MarR family transcriptional regulator